MARRAGGYRRSDPTEWAECSRALYGEAISSANRFGQDVFTWMNDAISHHVHRVKLVQARDRYEADYAAWMEGDAPGQPMQNDPKYQVTDPAPTITRPGPRDAKPSTQRQPKP